MTAKEKDAVVDHLIDLMTELMMLETQIRSTRETLESVAGRLFTE